MVRSENEPLSYKHTNGELGFSGGWSPGFAVRRLPVLAEGGVYPRSPGAGLYDNDRRRQCPSYLSFFLPRQTGGRKGLVFLYIRRVCVLLRAWFFQQSCLAWRNGLFLVRLMMVRDRGATGFLGGFFFFFFFFEPFGNFARLFREGRLEGENHRKSKLLCGGSEGYLVRFGLKGGIQNLQTNFNRFPGKPWAFFFCWVTHQTQMESQVGKGGLAPALPGK